MAASFGLTTRPAVALVSPGHCPVPAPDCDFSDDPCCLCNRHAPGASCRPADDTYCCSVDGGRFEVPGFCCSGDFPACCPEGGHCCFYPYICIDGGCGCPPEGGSGG